MDKLEEVKKLKKLLDEGIIDEDDFAKKKAELLGISKSVPKEESKKSSNKSKSLDDYEKELMEQSEEEEKIEEKSKSKDIDDYYQKEKAKARAQLDAEEEIKSKRRAEQKVEVDKGVNKTKRILKWILAVVLWILGVGSICTTAESGLVYIPLGIIAILQGCMACPKITDYTQNNSKFDAYTMHKILIVWITIIVWVVLACVFPSNSQNNEANTNNQTTTSVTENQ